RRGGRHGTRGPGRPFVQAKQAIQWRQRVSDKKRQQIRDKVKKGEARVRARERTLSQRAAEARDSAAGFARENPLLVIAGGLALGVAVSMLFRRPREAGEKAARRASKKASGLAMLAAEV